MLRLTFWMNMPSFYQADLFRALARTGEVDLRVVFENKIPEERKNLGWENDLAGFEYEFLDSQRPVLDAIRRARRDRTRINVVSGLWAGKVPEAILATLSVSGGKYFIYSEAPDPRVVIPILKKKLVTTLGKWIVSRASGVLAISHFAAGYFKSYEIDDSKIIPFGYFRSMPPSPPMKTTAGKKNGVDIVFVGQLVHRKGVDILLAAVKALLLERQDLYLHLFGGGEQEKEYRNWAAERNLTSHIIFEGVVDSGTIMDKISEFDLLVLPSRWDGWGMVVNEAMMAGVPVIVSDMCGVADVVQEGVNGYMFHSEDVEGLKGKIEAFVSHNDLMKSLAGAALKTGVALQAENAVKYLLGVLRGSKFPREENSELPWIVS